MLPEMVPNAPRNPSPVAIFSFFVANDPALAPNAIEVNYTAIATTAGGPLCVVGNLPYYITSELLYSPRRARAHPG